MLILGFNSTHDASAALVGDGQLLCAVEEERLSRQKHHYGFPERSIDTCLKTAGVTWKDVDRVVFYWNPWKGLFPFAWHFVRHLPGSAKYASRQPDIWGRFISLRKELKRRYGFTGTFRYHDHHSNHLASAYYPSPFDEAIAMSIDGTGEWDTTVAAHVQGGKFKRLANVTYPHSLGKLWEVATQYLGFRPNSGEGKVMGLAPYGEPRFLDTFRSMVRPHGGFGYRLDKSWFLFHLGSDIKYSPRWEKTFAPARKPESELDDVYADVARSLQELTEEMGVRMVRWAVERTGCRKLCLAGGVALNSVMNGRILRESGIDDIYIQPSAGDAGAALGAALQETHLVAGITERQEMRHAYWGPDFSDSELERAADGAGYRVRHCPGTVADESAALLESGKILGWFQGRMEYGPRALGARSIIADPRRAEMKDILNSKVKHREGFRPFAPACLATHQDEWFEGAHHSPFMLLVFPIKADKRALVPAVTHVDGTGRLQTVDEDSHPRYLELIEHFHRRTGVPIVVNTSFNIRGEPIVHTPAEAVDCFRRTGLDALVLGDWIVEKPDHAETVDDNKSS